MNYHEVKIFSRELRKNQTPSEKRLWEHLRDRKLDGFKFLRQHPIFYDRRGNDLNVFIPDFYCPSAHLAIELDGGIHKSRRVQDQRRDAILSSLKIKVVRFQNRQLDDIEPVLNEIKAHLKTKVPTPQPLPAGREGQGWVDCLLAGRGRGG